MSFDLQLLNGFGEPYDKPTQAYEDQENRYINTVPAEEEGNGISVQTPKGNDMNDMDNELPASDGRCYCACTKEGCVQANKWVKYALVFAVGAVAGQWLKKLFKDDEPKRSKE